MSKYALASVFISVLALVLTALGYEKRSTNLRRTVLISVMTALSVIGRFIFAPVPAFKPITAMIVITGMWLGPGAGFACGAFTALISNIYFGQGPWTPFQMTAFGLIGLGSGLLAKPLRRYVPLLLGYGLIAGVIYSFIMDVWNVLWLGEGFSLELYKASLLTAVPYTIMYALSNVIFLVILAPLFRRKMLRLLYKYGI